MLLSLLKQNHYQEEDFFLFFFLVMMAEKPKKQSETSESKKTEKKKGKRKRRGKTFDFINPFERLERENDKPPGYYHINLKWSTADPHMAHSLARLVFEDQLVIDCRRKILSVMTSNDLGVFDARGEAVSVDPQLNLIIQRYYKDFIHDAYEAYLIYGVVPIVLLQISPGIKVPKVPAYKTYLLQTAYSIEDERQVYRVIRPIHFCARPDDLKYYQKLNIADYPTFMGVLGQQFMGKDSLNLEPNASIGKNIIYSSVKDSGWFIDPFIGVIDIFNSAPSVLGEIHSPLSGLIREFNMTIILGNIMMQAQRKMIRPTYLVEQEPEKNTERHLKTLRNGSIDMNHPGNLREDFDSLLPGGVSADPFSHEIRSMGMDEILMPIPDASCLRPEDLQRLRRQQDLINSQRDNPLFRNPASLDGKMMQSYMSDMISDTIRGETNERLRFCPKGFNFASVNKHPETHAGDNYLDVKDALSRSICSSLEVPISIIMPPSRESDKVATGQRKIFQQTIAMKAKKFDNIITSIFRETFGGGDPRFGKMFSIKEMSERYDLISAANNRDKDRYYRSIEKLNERRGNQGMNSVHAYESPGTIPEMLPRVAALPMLSKSDVSHIMKAKKPESKPSKPGNEKEREKEKEKDDRIKPIDSEMDTDSNGELELSGEPEQPLADVTNWEREREIRKRNREVSDELILRNKRRKIENGKEEEEESTRSKSKTENDSDSENESDDEDAVDPNTFSIRLYPVIDADIVDLTEVARSGAIPVSQYQQLMCQLNGITPPPVFGGLYGARKASEYFRIVNGEEHNEELELEKENRGDKRDKEMMKMKQTQETEKMSLQHKYDKENAKLNQGSGKTPSSSSGSNASSPPSSSSPSSSSSSSNSSSASSAAQNSSHKPKSSTSTKGSSAQKKTETPQQKSQEKKKKDKQSSKDSESSDDEEESRRKKDEKKKKKRKPNTEA